MNIDVYSDRAKQAVQSAQSLALARRHQHLAPEHVLKVPGERQSIQLDEESPMVRTAIYSTGQAAAAKTRNPNQLRDERLSGLS